MAKKPASQDWHKEDIKAALHKRGITLKGLTLANGYQSEDAVAQALHRPYPKVERIIARALDLKAENIWPTRYHADGSPKSGRGERGLGRYKAKFNGSQKQRNVNLTAGKST